MPVVPIFASDTFPISLMVRMANHPIEPRFLLATFGDYMECEFASFQLVMIDLVLDDVDDLHNHIYSDLDDLACPSSPCVELVPFEKFIREKVFSFDEFCDEVVSLQQLHQYMGADVELGIGIRVMLPSLNMGMGSMDYGVVSTLLWREGLKSGRETSASQEKEQTREASHC